ncbi:MAG: LysM peptidoglycan-binding domain-containing protein [Chloroflexi bacterium]|nr:LysM peptidoglycan-binding domain-containing protein [Chloroflexota bacterium]
MSRTVLAHFFVLALVLTASLGSAGAVRAGGVCGGTYIAESGDTVEKIASKCGTTASAIYAANPGISSKLSAGQALTVPGPSGTSSGSTTSGSSTSSGSTYSPVTYSGKYYVKYGDTFSAIAKRYGVSVNSLWAANPHIRDINYIYVGQLIYVPSSSGSSSGSSGSGTTPYFTYGTVPANTQKGTVKLTNSANGEVYVSLQGTTADGSSVINEYWVKGSMKVHVPAARYFYVAWVGGKKYTGSFNLGGEGDRSITFYSKKVVVD